MKFNMGCGHNRRDGYVNVDSMAPCHPDEVWNLEQTPWPWPDGCAEEVLFIHSLEHMGQDPAVFLAMMKELYRICAPGCRIHIHVPHPRHDDFIGDPTHVRPITPGLLSLFDRKLNDEWKAKGAANSPLAHYLEVDFTVVESRTMIADTWAERFQRGEISQEDVTLAIRHQNNVAKEFRITLEARKTA